MKGQWQGEYKGPSVLGEVFVNIDEVEGRFSGVACVMPNADCRIPSSLLVFETNDKAHSQVVEVHSMPLHPKTGEIVEWAEIKGMYPEGVFHLDKLHAEISTDEISMRIVAKSGEGSHFEASITKSSVDESKVPGRSMSWAEFKEHLATLDKNSGLIFRGQEQPWALCTSFHRNGRFRISEFVAKDVKELHRRLVGVTSHLFDLDLPSQRGAFFNLLQHHGYPTPLLDWTYSPYVAAFFAYRHCKVDVPDKPACRIYVFDVNEWEKAFRQIDALDPFFPHFSVAKLMAIDNPRMVPQQSVTTATNIHDIESYVLKKQNETGKDFIYAIDLPVKERELAMLDLRFMGITAGAMFPGIVGVCEELREKNFD
jgi:hypothetical protein